MSESNDVASYTTMQNNDAPPSIREIVELMRQELVLSDDDEIHKCGRPFLHILQDFPDYALEMAYGRLNDVPFNEVETCSRRLYVDAACWKVLGVLEGQLGHEEKKGEGQGKDGGENDKEDVGKKKDDWITDVVKTLDMALILTGAPKREELIELIFSALAGVIAEEKKEKEKEGGKKDPDAPNQSQHDDDNMSESDNPEEDNIRPPKRRKLSPRNSTSPHQQTIDIPPTFPTTLPPSLHPKLLEPMTRVDHPSLAAFEKVINSGRKPFIIENSISFWPALSEPSRSWNNPQYLLSHTLEGRRLVPVELGRSYTDDGWGQRILSFGEFMREHMFQSAEDQKENEKEDRTGNGRMKAKTTGYLAQHDLFAQIPSLRADIAIPDYCYTDPPPISSNPPNVKKVEKIETPLLNAWFGPANTISPLHTDPYHNILAQVVGYKYVRLYAPDQTKSLYPRGIDEMGIDMGNTSQIDLDEAFGVHPNISSWTRVGDRIGEWCEPGIGRIKSDEEDPEEEWDMLSEHKREFRERFPEFEGAKFVEGVLGPGDCLYIPVGWWHYVRSLTPSFSVSFWWN